jgi:hypothetical protein
MQHDCIVNLCLLTCAFGHLPWPYEWDEDEDTGLDFTLQWSGPKTTTYAPPNTQSEWYSETTNGASGPMTWRCPKLNAII